MHKKVVRNRGETIDLIDSFRAKIAFVLLFSVVALCIISLFAFNIMNVDVVNGRLYDYGLQYNSAWATEYSVYTYALLISFTSCIVAILLSIASVLVHLRTRTKRSLLVGSFFAVLGTAANIISMLLLYFIGTVVNIELYRYGLAFNLGWYSEYSSYMMYLWLFKRFLLFYVSFPVQ